MTVCCKCEKAVVEKYLWRLDVTFIDAHDKVHHYTIEPLCAPCMVKRKKDLDKRVGVHGRVEEAPFI